jgi:galactokinase
MTEERIRKSFIGTFNTNPTFSVKAPGRINLIGEHTDYNDGFVLPAAIDKSIYFCIAERADDLIRLSSVDLNDEIEISLQNLVKTEKPWANFLIGVIKEIINTGAEIKHGFNLAFGGDVPLGAGLSSSAAMESGIGTAMNELYQLYLSKLDLALIAQKAEHNFAGVRCGIMDMYASLMGKANQVIRLDCKSLTHTYLPFDFHDISIVLFNTGVKHNLADSEYNIRRQECEAGLKLLQGHFPEVSSFRDVKRSMLEKYQAEFEKDIYDRCDYVLAEEERMKAATLALNNSDLKTFGGLMFETHEGLKNLYRVSCPELDFLVDLAKDNSNILGARMMGGGFGGCTINLIKKDAVEEITNCLKAKYLNKFNLELDNFEVKIMDGCSVINTKEKDIYQ